MKKDLSWNVRVVASAPTIYVDGSRSGGDGSSWFAAYRELRDALAAARPGAGEIRVAQGTYTPGRKPTDTFRLIDGVSILGGFAGYGPAGSPNRNPDLRDISGYETILSGEVGAARSHHVITSSAIGSTAVLDGFTIQCGVAGAASNGYGGGLINFDGLDAAVPCGGSPVIRNCTFLDNAAWHGGGAVYSAGGDLTLESCVFQYNSADGGGGALYVRSGNPTVRDCRLEDNSTSRGDGGAIRIDGGGPRVIDCLFVSNLAGGCNGAALACLDGDPLIEGCSFLSNSGADRGGGLYSTAAVTLIGCVFEGNQAASGGAISCTPGDLGAGRKTG